MLCAFSRRFISVTFLGVALLTTISCAPQVHVTPIVADLPSPIPIILRGTIVYEGKQDYLPRTIAEGGTPDVSFHYRYSVDHSRKDNLLIGPRVGVVQQAGWKYAAIEAILEILNGATIVKSYVAKADVSVRDSEFAESMSNMRQRGILAVRDNIEAQMCSDKAELCALVKACAY